MSKIYMLQQFQKVLVPCIDDSKYIRLSTSLSSGMAFNLYWRLRIMVGKLLLICLQGNKTLILESDDA